MSKVRFQLVLSTMASATMAWATMAWATMALATVPFAPASASAPFVLAQFFEHFDEEPRGANPPANDPEMSDPMPDAPGLNGFTLPDFNDDLQSGVPQGTFGEGILEQGPVQLGGIPKALDPEDRPKLLAELYEKLGQAGSPSDAAPIIQSIEQLWTLSGSDTVDLLMGRAAAFANASEIDLSLAVLDAVVDIAPTEAEAWYLRAKVNVLAGKPERALSDLRRALILDAQHYRAITDLGLVLEQLGAKKKALDAYRRALAINPYMDDAQEGVDALQREVEGQDI